METSMIKNILATTIIGAVLILSGCGGGGASVQATSTTMGQELQDLDASYKKGIISENEYNSAKQAILDRYR